MIKKTLRDRILESISRNPDWDDPRIASAVRGATRALVRLARSSQPFPDDTEAGPAGQRDTGMISLEQVRKRYDIPAAIRAEIDALKPGALILERELCQRTAGKDAARFRRAVENTEDLRACRVKLKLDQDQPEGAFYWGRPQDVREALKLRDE